MAEEDEKVSSNSQNSFSREMRKATRDIHSISDTLINAKLAFALTDNDVWADGLLIFYEIFKFIEEHVSTTVLPEEYRRTEAFESDLAHYLGPNWKSLYQPRKAVLKYLDHLNNIANTKPNLLIAYVYHLYMGLLSGGQILQRKRLLSKKIIPVASDSDALEGMAVTDFGGLTIVDMKNKLRRIVDQKAEKFDEETKAELIAESRRVFELNNEIVRTVKGVNQVNMKKFGYMIALTGFCYLIYTFLSKK